MAKYPGGVTVSGYIAPSDTLDVYATHKAQFGQGGYRSTTDLNTRDAITPLRREIGMIVYVISEAKEYRLVGGIENSNWVEIVYAGGGNTKQNYIIVDNILDREIIPDSLRFIGLIVYVIDEDKEYRLKTGITNNDWVELTGSTGNIKQNYVIVASLADIENYPISDRFIGLVIYASDIDREYRLTGGIENSNWVEIQNITINTGGESGNSGGGSTSGDTIYNVTNNTINEYFNTLGCINEANIIQTIMSLSDSSGYTDENGNDVPSIEDSKVFSFKMNTDKYWFGDWIYFSGTTDLSLTGINEVFIEVKQNGNVEIFDLFSLLKTNTMSEKIQIVGNASIWNGYIKPENFGKCELTIYQTNNSSKMYNINKTIYLFKPNFVIRDSSTGFIVPSPINIKNNITDPKKYTIEVSSNTNLLLKLAKVKVTEKGIDNINYNVINSSIVNITASGEYVLTVETLREITIFGTYAIIVTGIDAGISIPTYFYGPFLINKV